MLFETDYKALVIGASGAIGEAFGEAFREDLACSYVELVSRANSPGFDITDAKSVAARALAAAQGGPYHIIVDATGALHIDGRRPEKALSELDAGHLTRAFQINAAAPILVLQQFAPLLAPGRSVYAKLSARLASLEDNHVGGWYGYRASKAALNMLLHTAAIELQRKNAELLVVALQPGTVRSNLSAPFAAGVPNLLEPRASVTGMLQGISQLSAKRGAHFVDHHGLAIPW